MRGALDLQQGQAGAEGVLLHPRLGSEPGERTSRYGSRADRRETNAARRQALNWKWLEGPGVGETIRNEKLHIIIFALFKRPKSDHFNAKNVFLDPSLKVNRPLKVDRICGLPRIYF